MSTLNLAKVAFEMNGSHAYRYVKELGYTCCINANATPKTTAYKLGCQHISHSSICQLKKFCGSSLKIEAHPEQETVFDSAWNSQKMYAKTNIN